MGASYSTSGVRRPTAVPSGHARIDGPVLVVFVPLALAASRATFLLCEDPASCPGDVAFAEGVLGEADPVRPVDLLLELDGGGWIAGVDEKARFVAALDAARTAVAGKRWAGAEAATSDALDALDRWPGTVPPEVLFEVWYLQGVARVGRGGGEGQAYSFRQAATVVDGKPPAELPVTDAGVERVWLDEVRKLTVGGRGTLVIDPVPPGAALSVDGRALPAGTHAVGLLPGNHRLTAVLSGRLRTWKAEVPVLAGRTSTVGVTFARGDDASWVRARLHEAFDTLAAPPEVLDLLVDWSARTHARELELLEVAEERRSEAPPPVRVSLPVEGRPAAADGERVDMGDGIPSTFHEEVIAVHQAAEPRPSDLPRLRILYFDPSTRRLRSEPRAPEVVPAPDRALHLGGEVGYLAWSGRRHTTVDLGCAWDVGPIGVEARLGLARADIPYNLQPDWVDRQIYRVAAAARWSPDWRVAPTVALGPELYVPIAVGGRLTGGVEGAIGAGWTARADLHLDVLDRGAGWGVGIGVGR